MNKKFFMISAVILIISLISISCKNINIIEKEECSISFSVGVESRTAFPYVQTVDFNKFALYGKLANNTGDLQLIKQFISITELEKSNEVISNGLWNFKLIAYINNSSSEDGTIYSSTIENINIIPGANILEFNLVVEKYDLENGKGAFSLEIDYKDEIPVKKVTARLIDFYEQNGECVYETQNLDIFEKEQNVLKSVCYQKVNVPAGVYLAKFVFYGDEDKKVIINEYSVCCYVIKNLMTNQSIVLDNFENIYSVSYNWNGGSLNKGENIQTTFSRKNEFDLPDETAVYRKGYTFAGWYESEDFNGNPITRIEKSFTKNISLYAKWIPKKYTITLKAKNGEELTDVLPAITSLEHTYGNITELPVLIKDGYNFCGWYADIICNKEEFDSLDADSIVQDTVIYALFKPREFDIEYCNKTGTQVVISLPEYAPKKHIYSTRTELVDAYNSDCSFIGWFSDKECTNRITYIDDFSKISDNKIFVYADWEDCISVYVSELDNRLEEIQDKSHLYNVKIIDPVIIDETEGQKLREALLNHQDIMMDLNFLQLTRIQNANFSELNNLNIVYFPENVDYDKFLFTDCTKLRKVRLPKNLTKIEDSAFEGCLSLQEFNFTEGIETIGNRAFNGCQNLYNIELPDSLEELGENVFNGCANHTEEGVVKIAEVSVKSSFISKLLYFKTKINTEMTITVPNGIISINNNEFDGWESIVEIKIPDTVTSIGNYAFNGCIKLNNITLPDNITSLGEGAFCNCKSIECIELPAGITELKDKTFSECKSLQSITNLSSVTKFGVNVFNACSELESISISKETLSIGIQCFIDCKKLSTIEFEEDSKLSMIDDSAFYGCSSLINISLPDTVITIGDDAFNLCTNLTTVSLPQNLKSISDRMFSQCSNLSEIVITENVKSIGQAAFYACNNLSTIKIPSNVESLSTFAFQECSILSEIEFFNSDIEIPGNAFKNCSEISNVICHGNEDVWRTKLENITELKEYINCIE